MYTFTLNPTFISTFVILWSTLTYYRFGITPNSSQHLVYFLSTLVNILKQFHHTNAHFTSMMEPPQQTSTLNPNNDDSLLEQSFLDLLSAAADSNLNPDESTTSTQPSAPNPNPTTNSIILPSPLTAPSVVYVLPCNSHPLYFVQRGTQVYFLQKNIAQVFYNNSSTFNGICWANKVEKVPATSLELKVIRDNNPMEKSLKKATLLSIISLTNLFIQVKREDIIRELLAMIPKLVCYHFLHTLYTRSHFFL